MILIVKCIVYALAISFTAWLIPGISVANFWSAMLACVVIAIINVFVKPVIKFISLPINILTVGLFSLVINALLLMLAGWITPGLHVDGFLSALLGSLILSVCSVIVSKL